MTDLHVLHSWQGLSDAEFRATRSLYPNSARLTVRKLLYQAGSWLPCVGYTASLVQHDWECEVFGDDKDTVLWLLHRRWLLMMLEVEDQALAKLIAGKNAALTKLIGNGTDKLLADLEGEL